MERKTRISNPPSKSVMIQIWRYDTMHSNMVVNSFRFVSFSFIQLNSIDLMRQSILIYSFIQSYNIAAYRKKWHTDQKTEKKKAKAKPLKIATHVYSAVVTQIFTRERETHFVHIQKKRTHRHTLWNKMRFIFHFIARLYWIF